LPTTDAAIATTGWAGDNYQVFYNDLQNDIVMVAHWIWDTEEDGEEFNNAMRTYLEKRYAGRIFNTETGDCWRSSSEIGCLFTPEEGSYWVLIPDQSFLNRIFELYENLN